MQKKTMKKICAIYLPYTHCNFLQTPKSIAPLVSLTWWYVLSVTSFALHLQLLTLWCQFTGLQMASCSTCNIFVVYCCVIYQMLYWHVDVNVPETLMQQIVLIGCLSSWLITQFLCTWCLMTYKRHEFETVCKECVVWGY